MSFGRYYCQSTCFFYFFCQFNIGTSTSHIGCNSHFSRLPCFCYYLCFSLMMFSIKDVMRDTSHFQHSAEFFRNINGSSTNKTRTAMFPHFFYLIDYRVNFLFLRFINQVFFIVPDNGSVGWNYDNIQFVYFPKFSCFGFGCTGHTGKFVIHTEIILQRNSSIGLSDLSDFYTFFGFDSLMQSIRISSSFHHTSGLLINDLYFAVHHYIFFIFFKQCICFEQLIYSMKSLGF